MFLPGEQLTERVSNESNESVFDRFSDYGFLCSHADAVSTHTSAPFIKFRHSYTSNLLETLENVSFLPAGFRLTTINNSRCFSVTRTTLCSVLTCVSRVGSGAVKEAGGSRNAQVGHPSRSISVHGGRDGVVVGLLRRGARHVAARRHTVGVAGVTWRRKQGSIPAYYPVSASFFLFMNHSEYVKLFSNRCL